MTIFKKFNVTLVNSEGLKEEHDKAFFDGRTFTGISVTFKSDSFSKLQSWADGRKVSNNYSDLCEEIFPYPFVKHSDLVVDFDGLRFHDEELYEFGVKFREELFTGVAIEFADGVFETLYRYENGVLNQLVSWNRKGKLIDLRVVDAKSIFEYQTLFGGGEEIYISADGTSLSIRNKPESCVSYLRGEGGVEKNIEIIDRLIAPFYLDFEMLLREFEFERRINVSEILDSGFLKYLDRNMSVGESSLVFLKDV